MKNKSLIGIVVMVLLAGGFILARNAAPTDTENTSIPTADIVEEVPGPTNTQEVDYPKLYRDHNLPEYSNATLVDSGRQTESLKDGLKLQLESEESVQIIGAYYEKEMGALGWEIPEQKFKSDDLYAGNYSKGDLVYQIVVTRFPEMTKITISFLESL